MNMKTFLLESVLSSIRKFSSKIELSWHQYKYSVSSGKKAMKVDLHVKIDQEFEVYEFLISRIFF